MNCQIIISFIVQPFHFIQISLLCNSNGDIHSPTPFLKKKAAVIFLIGAQLALGPACLFAPQAQRAARQNGQLKNRHGLKPCDSCMAPSNGAKRRDRCASEGSNATGGGEAVAFLSEEPQAIRRQNGQQRRQGRRKRLQQTPGA